MAAAPLFAMLLLRASATPYPNVCAAGSPWNTTACAAGWSCCPNAYSPSGWGCAPFPNAVCCPDNFSACPAGTVCVRSAPPAPPSWNTSVGYNCSTPGGEVARALPSCKGGPPLPPDGARKNVVYIGDSLSEGLQPVVAAALADVALVQHAPWGGGGGAGTAALAAQCAVPYFLRSPSGIPVAPDVVLFNSGMHNTCPGTVTPGKCDHPSAYLADLESLTAQLLAWAGGSGARLVFALTTLYECDATVNGFIQQMNRDAQAVMARHGIAVLNGTYEAILEKCGPPPHPGCASEPSWGDTCFCPHCGPAYAWLAAQALVPQLRAFLGA